MNRLAAWLDARFPFRALVRVTMTEYYAPKNFNFWYYFGSLALLVLVIQIVSGIFLLAHYQPSADGAFASVETIMYDVKWGWLVRYLHTTGANLFFVVIYLHMLRALLYGSFKRPRELVWLIGFAIYICLMAEAYFGYVLPFGNMSYWGGQVITSIVGAIPWIGGWLVEIVRGGFGIGTATLNRFMAFHVVLVPALLALLVVAHILALHETGSNNPDGIEVPHSRDDTGNPPADGIPFHPYYTVKDTFGVGVFLIVFALIVLYAPTLHGLFIEPYNHIPANPLQTPPDITPAWYLAPFYAMLRAIPNKLAGIAVLAAAILLPFILPWLDRNPVKSSRYRPVYFGMVVVLAASFAVLGWIGMQPASPALLLPARVCLGLYLLFFALLPLVSMIEPIRRVPERVRT
jgi:ubiquinol-cytochrome c reductase cytochrome b subunit